MKKHATFAVLHRVFAASAFIIIGGFLGFMGYLYVAFNGILTGNVRTELSPDLLANLQVQRFDNAVNRMERRMALPDIPADLQDPFDAPSK